MTTCLTLCVAAVLLGASSPDASEPPDTSPATSTAVEEGDLAAAPGAGQTDTEFERRLAELSFAEFLGVATGTNTNLYACAEPESVADGTPILCFAALGEPDEGGIEVLVAETVVSGGSGMFSFEFVDTAPPPSSAPSTEPATVSVPVGDVATAANLAVLAAGREIDAGAEAFVEQYLADPRIASVEQYDFDATAALLTLSVTLASDVSFTPEDLAWGNTAAFAERYWSAGAPLRAAGATVLPGFAIVVDGAAYTSDFATMTAIADGAVTRTEWLAAVTASTTP